MIYRKSECCITPEELECNLFRKDCCTNDGVKPDTDMMGTFSALRFALIDLNLYLDTHPNDKEALQMFNKISKTLQSARYDHIRRNGPLVAGDSSADAPFEWASSKYKWPWEK